MVICLDEHNPSGTVSSNDQLIKLLKGQGVDLLEKRGWDDRAGDMIEV